MIGTLKEAEGRLSQAFPGRNWPDRISKAVSQYNTTVHSATGFAPQDVTVDNSNIVFRRLYKPFDGVKNLPSVIPLGTTVRLRLMNRGIFTKAHTPRNSVDTFTVGRIRLHPTGIKYKLFSTDGGIPIAGTWNRSEFVPIKLPQH